MSESMVFTKQTNSGRLMTRVITKTAESKLSSSAVLPAAKTGTLSTRTDNNTGILTMAAGHGITTGQRLDLYWAGGSRRGMVVGTVATNSVPIDLGAGDNLPVLTTAITAQVPTAFAFDLVGNNMVGLACGVIAGSGGPMQFTFEDIVPAEVFNVTVQTTSFYDWNVDEGVTNPMAGDTPVVVYASNGDSANTVTVAVCAIFNN